MEEDFEIKYVGISFAVDKILEETGIEQILNASFGEKKARCITTAVKFMVANGNVFEHCEDWCEDNLLFGSLLTSQSSSRLFESISEKEKFDFFKQWVKKFDSEDYIAYDVTSFSTYAKTILDAERGYNRDKEKLPQINLGSYFGEKSGLPMFYTTYQGSINDKSDLQSMMSYNEDLGVKNVKFVMDKGFCTTSNLQYMRGKYPCIVAADNRVKSVRQAIFTVKNSICSMRNRTEENTYASSVKDRFYGVTATLHIFFNNTLCEEQRSTLEHRIQLQESELFKLSKITKKEIRKYGKYFTIIVSKDASFTYARDYSKIDEIASTCGFFCILTDLELSPKDILKIYRRKELIENSFDDIKNSVDMKRIRTHIDDTTNGKIFCAYISLIVLSEIANRLRDFNSKNKNENLIKSEVLHELKKLRFVKIDNNKRLRTISKSGRTSLEALNFNADLLKSYLLV